LGTGLSYSIVYSTLLVKLVFLVSLNSGVYLPATYQALLLCFAVLIQLVIGKTSFLNILLLKLIMKNDFRDTVPPLKG
jgi:hypothetical protein